MNTSKPISTITYNTEEFLRKKIEYWKKCGIIEFAMWIKHEPDVDGAKPHFHVYMAPAKKVQTMDLEKASHEYDPENPEKPLKMRPFKSSKVTDWILYGIHDPVYLAEKGLSRNVSYSFEDVQSTDEDYLQDIITEAVESRLQSIEVRLYASIQKGMTWQDIVCSGLIPLRYMSNAHLFYKSCTGQVPDYFANTVKATLDSNEA